MGSFNTTCCVSRSTIKPSDEVMLFPVIQSATYHKVALKVPVHETLVEEMGFAPEKELAQHGISNSTCYPVAFWNPVQSPLHCTYEDYGNFEMLDTLHNRVVFSEFVNYLIGKAAVTIAGENEYHDLPFDINEIMKANEFEVLESLKADIEKLNAVFHDIQQVVSEHRVFAQSIYNADYFPLQFSVIAKVAFDELIALTNSATTWDDEPLEQQAVFSRAVGKIRKLDIDTNDLEGDIRAALSYVQTDSIMQGINIGSAEGIHFRGERNAAAVFIGMYAKGEMLFEQFYENFKPYLDVRWAISGMMSLNAKFTPQEYASQDYNNEIGREFAKFAATVAAKMTEEEDEE